jgi:hypothetical protein
MSEMVERVARACGREFISGQLPILLGPDAPKLSADALQRSFEALARAAIAAMREPTWAMGGIGDAACAKSWRIHHLEEAIDPFPIGSANINSAYRAMIDAALSEDVK